MPICLDSLDSNFSPLPESACYCLCGRHFRLWLQLPTLNLFLFSWRAHPHPSLKWRFQIIPFVPTSFLYLSYPPPQPSVYFVSLFMAAPESFTVACRLSLVEGRGRTLHCSARAGLLIPVLSLVQEHGLENFWTPVATACELSCCMVWGIFPDQGLSPCSLHWQVDY